MWFNFPFMPSVFLAKALNCTSWKCRNCQTQFVILHIWRGDVLKSPWIICNLPKSHSKSVFDLYGECWSMPCTQIVSLALTISLFYVHSSLTSLHFIAQLIIKHTPIHSHASVHAHHTHTHAYTHILSSVWWGVWTAPTDCASLPLCSGVPVVPSPIAVNATIWCATWTS